MGLAFCDGCLSLLEVEAASNEGKKEVVNDVDYLLLADVTCEGELAVEDVDGEPGEHRR